MFNIAGHCHISLFFCHNLTTNLYAFPDSQKNPINPIFLFTEDEILKRTCWPSMEASITEWLPMKFHQWALGMALFWVHLKWFCSLAYHFTGAYKKENQNSVRHSIKAKDFGTSSLKAYPRAPGSCTKSITSSNHFQNTKLYCFESTETDVS